MSFLYEFHTYDFTVQDVEQHRGSYTWRAIQIWDTDIRYTGVL